MAERCLDGYKYVVRRTRISGYYLSSALTKLENRLPRVTIHEHSFAISQITAPLFTNGTMEDLRVPLPDESGSIVKVRFQQFLQEFRSPEDALDDISTQQR